jgi:hypothetical protein
LKKLMITAAVIAVATPALADNDALPRCVFTVVSYEHRTHPAMTVDDMPDAIVSHCIRQITASQRAIGEAKTAAFVENSARAAFAFATRNGR